MSLLEGCKNNKFDQVVELLQHQYDHKLINEQDKQGRTSLHYSVLSNQKLVCELLLENGASCTIQDGQGHTPLHLALSQNKPNECIQILSQSKYDWTTQDAFGRSAIHWICSRGYYGVLQSILTKNNPQQSILQDALEEKKESKQNDTQIIIKCNAISALNLVNKGGQSALHWAVDNDEWKCLELLLEMAELGHLDVTITDVDGLTAADLCKNAKFKKLINEMIHKQRQVIIKKEQHEKAENEQNQFVITNKSKVKPKVKGKGKRKGKMKMKIKLKK